jgi:hypothetical protein
MLIKKVDVRLTMCFLSCSQLRDIRHENLNQFIGACLYDESLILINDYCSRYIDIYIDILIYIKIYCRGSIKDLLENVNLKMDDMFISSLVGDLLKVSLSLLFTFSHSHPPISSRENILKYC